MKKNKYRNLILLLIITLVLSNITTIFPIKLLGLTFYLSIIIYPFTFLIANLIIKEIDFGKILISIIITIIINLVIFKLLDAFTNLDINMSIINASLAAFGVSHLINSIFVGLTLKKERFIFPKILLTFLFVLFIDEIIFYIAIGNRFDLSFLFSILVKFIVAFILTIIYKQSVNQTE